MSHTHQINAVGKPIIFREYIGVRDIPKNLKDFPAEMINDDIEEFHFILGTLREVYSGDGKGKGEFYRTWNFNNFSPAKVAKLKKDHKNVKVIISIGGFGAENPFDPKEIEAWSTKAKKSIKKLINEYQEYSKDSSSTDGCHCDDIIDGIDINYEYSNCNQDEFSSCIGELIRKLKKSCKSIKLVSIAPTERLKPHYHQLYWANKEIINWVDYKFYNQTVSSADELVNLYNKLLNEYGTDVKLLPGVSTDPDSNTNMTRDVFIKGCKSLLQSESLPGIFVWNANDSAMPSNEDNTPYFLEEVLQDLLTDN